MSYWNAREYLLEPFTPLPNDSPSTALKNKQARDFINLFADDELTHVAVTSDELVENYFIFTGGPPINVYFIEGEIQVCPREGTILYTENEVEAADYVKSQKMSVPVKLKF